MKKTAVKVLVPILALLMLLSMASSVRAGAPPTKTPVTVYITGITGQDLSTLKYVVSGNMMYLLYFKLWGTILIFVDGSSTPISVNWVDVCWGTYNIATNLGSYTFFEVWTLPDGGQFVGFDHPHTVGDFLSAITGYPAVTAMEAHIIVVGICHDAGQVINVASPNLFVTGYGLTGYWLIP